MKKKFKKLPILIVLLAILTLIIFFSNTNIIFRLFDYNSHFSLIKEFQISPNSNFATSNKGIFISDNFNIKFIDFYGNIRFSDSVDISNFYLVSEGNFALIIENMGNSAIVYNYDGMIYQISTINPIINFSLGYNGELAIITAIGNSYDIFVYNEFGFLEIQKRHYESLSFPFAIEIDSSNGIFVLSYIDINAAYINSIISIYDINDGSLISSNINNSNRIVGFLEFIDSDIFSISQSNIMRISSYNAATIWEIDINMHNFSINDNFILIDNGNYNKIFNLRGDLINYFPKKSYVDSFENAIIFKKNENYYAINSINGSLYWEKSIYAHNSNIFFMGSRNRILVISGFNARLFERIRI